MTVRLLAAEQDGNGGDDDFVDDGQDSGAQNQDDAGDAQDDQAQDDQADDLSADDGNDAGQQAADVKRRRAIEERATRSREESTRLANETAAATAQSVARATADATRQAAAEQREAEAVAAMTDEQRATYTLAKETQRLKQSETTTQALLRSTSDQNSFGRLLSRKPQYEKFEAEVERRHQQILAQGGFTNREVILAHLLGERALKAEGNTQQRQNASRRVEAQRGQSGGRSGRGDGGGNNGAQNQRPTTVSRAEKEDWAI